MDPLAMSNVSAAGNVGMVRSFSALERAEAAKAAILSLGLSAEAVQLQVIQDEAGPVESNFLVGNGHESSNGSAYEANFAQPVARGSCLLVVSSISDSQRPQVEAALNEFGGVDVDAAAKQADDNSLKST